MINLCMLTKIRNYFRDKTTITWKCPTNKQDIDWWKKAVRDNVKIDDITQDNFKDILNSILYQLKHSLKKKDALQKLGKKILDKWHKDETWLKKIRVNIHDDAYKSIPSGLHELDKLCNFVEGDLTELMYSHFIMNLDEKKIQDYTNLIFDAKKNLSLLERMMLLQNILEKIDELRKKDLMNKLFGEIKNKDYECKTLFIFDVKYFESLNDDNQKTIYEDQDVNHRYKEFLNKCLEFHGTLRTLLIIAKGIALEQKDNTITISHINFAANYLSLASDDYKDESITNNLSVLLHIISDSNPKNLVESGKTYLNNGSNTKDIIPFDKATQLFIKLFNKYISEKHWQKIFSFENPGIRNTIDLNNSDIKKIYLEILKTFTKTLYTEKEYQSALVYWEKYYEDKKDFNTLFHIVETLNHLKQYKEIFKYEEHIRKYEATLKSQEFIEAEIPDNKPSEEYFEDNKRIMLVLFDRLLTACRETKVDLAVLHYTFHYLRMMINSTKNVVDLKTITFYSFPVYKYLWLLKQANLSDKFNEFIQENRQTCQKIYAQTQNKGELLKTLKDVSDKFINDDQIEEKKQEMKEKKEIYQEHVVKLFEKIHEYYQVVKPSIDKGGYLTILLLAKYEAIRTNDPLITKKHIEIATQYICCEKITKEIFEEFGIQENSSKLKPEETQLFDVFLDEKKNPDDDVKKLIVKFKENDDAEYFTLFDNLPCEKMEKFRQYNHDIKPSIDKGGYSTILLLAKYEAIRTNDPLITKKHIEAATQYICCEKITKEIFEEFDIQENSSKLKTEETQLFDAFSEEKKNPDDDVKKLIVKFKENDSAKYCTLFEGQPCEKNPIESI